MTRRAEPQRQLFPAPKAEPKDQTAATILMREVGKGTDLAWHLAPLRDPAKIGFAPRSLVTRGEGAAESQFTMPRWIAAERGWL